MKTKTSFEKKVAVTGGAGFIGSNLLRYMVPRYRRYLFVNIDCLTYAGNPANLRDIEKDENYIFEKINITDFDRLHECFEKYEIDALIHLAAESHVDRSIIGPGEFVETNIKGTFNLLETARASGGDFRFHHVSTDEVFGSVETGRFSEVSRYDPSSPYAASKASADHLVAAYYKTYLLDAVTSNCSNNFGPYQFPEKLIPLTIRNALENKPIPVYGDGDYIRDWIFVDDHCRALDLIFHRGRAGETYNVGGGNELSNVDLIRRVCRIVDKIKGGGPREELIVFVDDRPGHDRRYALDSSKIKAELGWEPEGSFDESLERTVRWYLDNQKWLDDCISGEYMKYYDMNYSGRRKI